MRKSSGSWCIAVENVEKVLERLGTTESTTLALKREGGEKIRVGSLLWEAPKVILKNEMLEIRNVDGSLHIARKVKHYDEWDPQLELYADNSIDAV
jgi:hypothetical protein